MCHSHCLESFLSTGHQITTLMKSLPVNAWCILLTVIIIKGNIVTLTFIVLCDSILIYEKYWWMAMA